MFILISYSHKLYFY